MSPANLAFVVIAAVVVGWFALGIIWNLRLGRSVLAWLQGGLPQLGARATLRWLGSSVVELGIARAERPFASAKVLVVMQPRDVPWLWLAGRMRGRRDLLIVRGELVEAPGVELDLTKPHSWSELLSHGERESTWATESVGEFALRSPPALLDRGRAAAAAALEGGLGQLRPTLERLAVRRRSPQLEVHLRLPDPRRADASRIVGAWREVAKQMASS